MTRTSLTHPLEIAAVRPLPTSGRVGITFCPGKKQADALTGAWDRDLALDLDAICLWGAKAVLTLIENHEFRMLGVEALGQEVRARGLRWRHAPIPDYSTPGAAFDEAWPAIGCELRGLLLQGDDIVVHCKGGLGRAGTIAAHIMVELGTPPIEAISQVRAVRPGAIETAAQEAYVMACGRPSKPR